MNMEPNVFEYTNYRKFLKDSYNHLKKTKEKFSYRWFAARAGFSSSSFLYLIIEGDRNLSKDYVPKFSEVLGLTKKERQYFDALVSFNQAKSPEAKKYYLELMYNLRKYKAGTPLADGQYEYLSRWYHPVIRELISMPDFREDPEWIKERLLGKVTPRQVEDAIETLLQIGLLKRNASGHLEPATANIVTEDEVMNTAALAFHQQMIAFANEIMSTLDAGKREVSGITMALSQKQFMEIKIRIKEFENEIASYLVNNPDTPDKVYQLHYMLFPLTTSESREVTGGSVDDSKDGEDGSVQ